MDFAALTRGFSVCAAAALSLTLLPTNPVQAFSEETAAQTSPALEEITVTAQRREQRLQDVGISVTALSADTINNLNIVNATDVVRAVPSLKMNAYSSAQVVFNIRGVSQNDYGDQQEPPVAVYQDDSYSSSINLASFPIFDLARVEALRGPQGTLFGRNATGGAIQFISAKPTKEFEGFVKLTYGRFNQQIYEGAVSGSLTDTLQSRLSFIYDRDNGYIKELNPGLKDRGADNHYAIRDILAWEPTDTTKVNLTLRFMRAPKERQAGLYSLEAACPNAQFQGEFTGANQSCGFWGTGPGQTGTGYRNDAISPTRGGTPWATAENQESYVDRKIFGSTLRVDSTLGDFGFISITDYQHSSKFYLEGGDASPDDGVLFYQGSKLDQASQEFRGSTSLGSHEVVAGVFGMYINGEYTGKFADPFYGYDPTVSFTQKTASVAVFAQDEWKFADQFKLITGVRYWRDKRSGSYFGSAPEVPGLSDPVTIIFSKNEIYPDGSNISPADTSKVFNGVTARLELDYKPIDEVLLYASYNRGSKSGGYTFSTGTPYHPNEQAFLNGIPFKPEVLNSFEFGAKTQLNRAMTLNTSAFYYIYKDYQAFAQIGPIQSVINLDAHEYGLEVELNARPIEALTLQVGTSFLNSTVKNILLPDLATTVNHDLPQAPAFSANALARYEVPIGHGMMSIQTDAQYSGGFCFTVLCAPVEKEGAYFIANGRVGYSPDRARWDFAAYVDNMLQREYRVYAFDSSLFAGVVAGVYAKPRTWGITATYKFGAAAAAH